MELGNMIFGCSRGEFEVDRAWQDILCYLFSEAGLDCRGYPETNTPVKGWDGEKFESDTFIVRPYNWSAECTCGFDDELEEWWENNPHSKNCYSVVKEGHKRKLLEPYKDVVEDDDGYISFFSLKDDKLRKRLEREHKEFVDNLCKERGLNPLYGREVHCDCGVVDRFNKTFKDRDHKKDCEFVLPNFYHKPTGFSLQWYKYPLRDSYKNQDINYEGFKAIVKDCLISVWRDTGFSFEDVRDYDIKIKERKKKRERCLHALLSKV